MIFKNPGYIKEHTKLLILFIKSAIFSTSLIFLSIAISQTTLLQNFQMQPQDTKSLYGLINIIIIIIFAIIPILFTIINNIDPQKTHLLQSFFDDDNEIHNLKILLISCIFIRIIITIFDHQIPESSANLNFIIFTLICFFSLIIFLKNILSIENYLQKGHKKIFLNQEIKLLQLIKKQQENLGKKTKKAGENNIKIQNNLEVILDTIELSIEKYRDFDFASNLIKINLINYFNLGIKIYKKRKLSTKNTILIDEFYNNFIFHNLEIYKRIWLFSIEKSSTQISISSACSSNTSTICRFFIN